MTTHLSFTDEEVDNNDGESHNDLEQVEHYLPTCRMESCPEGKGVALRRGGVKFWGSSAEGVEYWGLGCLAPGEGVALHED